MDKLRYVVLHHIGIPEPHYDFMFETAPGSLLMTFRFPRWPPGARMGAVHLAEHRRDYLEYQGPLSGARGEVKRVGQGSCRVSVTSYDRWELVLDDTVALTLSRGTGQMWCACQGAIQ
jgi:hypothetical protein